MPKDGKAKTDDQTQDFVVEEPEDTNIIEDLLPEDMAPEPEDIEPETETEEPDDAQDDGEDEGPDDTTEDEGTGDDGEPEHPAPKKYKVDGQEYTAEELIEKGLMDNLVTQANQASHYQELYHGIKDHAEQQAAQAQAQAQAQVQPQTQPIQADQIKAAMQPFLAQAVDQGYMEADFVNEFPAMAATQMYAYNDLMKMKQVVVGMYQYFMKDVREKTYKKVKGDFDNYCLKLTGVNQIYTSLKDQAERDRFFDYVSNNINPEASVLSEEFLGRVYLAYQQDKILPTLQQTATANKTKRNKKRKLAKGESAAAARTDKQHRQQPTVDDTIMDAMLDYFGN